MSIGTPAPVLGTSDRRVVVTFHEFVWKNNQLMGVFKVEDRAGTGTSSQPMASLVLPLAPGDIAKLADPRPIESIFLITPQFGGSLNLDRVDWWPFPYDAVIVGVEPWFGHTTSFDGVIEYVVVVGRSLCTPTVWATAAGGGAPADNGTGGVTSQIVTAGNFQPWDDNLLFGRNLDFVFQGSAAPNVGNAALSGPAVWRHLQNDEHSPAAARVTWPNETLGPAAIRVKKGDLVAIKTWANSTNGIAFGAGDIQSGVHLFFQRGG